MEIVTYVIKGQLEHRDTLGNSGIISPGEVQRMSAGTGIRHSEFNPSEELETQLVQLWLFPAVPQLPPSWEQKRYPLAERDGKLLPVAIPAGSASRPAHAVEIHQDATIYTSLLGPGQSVSHTLAPGRRSYIFVIAGELRLNGHVPCRRSGPHHRGNYAQFRRSGRRFRRRGRFPPPRPALTAFVARLFRGGALSLLLLPPGTLSFRGPASAR
jgi:redox-sensitive bicupin YhaK (pirin superfamily)